MVGDSAKVGQVLVFGVWLLPNGRRDDAVLDELQPANAANAEGLRLRYSAIRLDEGPCGDGGIGAAHGWPPSGCKRLLHPVRGFHYRPGDRVQVLVGASASRRGKWTIPAFRLRYHIGGRSYAAVYHQGLDIQVRVE